MTDKQRLAAALAKRKISGAPIPKHPVPDGLKQPFDPILGVRG